MHRLPKWFARHRDTFVRYAHALEVWTLVSIMVGGGFCAGYLTSQVQVGPILVQRDGEHNAEISRLQAAYQAALHILERRIGVAASTANAAANTANEAANTAEEAATTATTAATTSTNAVKAATAVVRASRQQIETGRR